MMSLYSYSLRTASYLRMNTRRPASADRTARRQFQATGQPVSRTQANDAMTSRLPRYEAKCVQRRCFRWGSVPLRSDIKGTELSPANILIPLERQLIALQLLPLTVFGRPSVKRFPYAIAPLSCPVCLSMAFVHCGQTVGRIKMKVSMQVGIAPRNCRPISVAAKWLHGSRCHLVWR